MPIKDIEISDEAKSAFLDGLGVDPHLRTLPVLSLPFYALSIAGLGTSGEPARPTSLGWHFLTRVKDGLVSGEVPNAPDSSQSGLSTSLTRGSTVGEVSKAYTEVK